MNVAAKQPRRRDAMFTSLVLGSFFRAKELQSNIPIQFEKKEDPITKLLKSIPNFLERSSNFKTLVFKRTCVFAVRPNRTVRQFSLMFGRTVRPNFWHKKILKYYVKIGIFCPLFNIASHRPKCVQFDNIYFGIILLKNSTRKVWNISHYKHGKG